MIKTFIIATVYFTIIDLIAIHFFIVQIYEPNLPEFITVGFQEVPGTLVTKMDSVINKLLINTTKYSKNYNSFKNISSIFPLNSCPYLSYNILIKVK